MNHDAMTYRNLRTVRRLPVLAALALTIAAPLALSACQQQAGEEAPLAGSDIGGPFTLTDKSGKSVTWDSLNGKWRAVYFGYTFCPDACPLDVQELMRGFNQFTKDHAEAAAKVQPIFISIDPARDTPEVVGQWTAAFGPKLLGLTGTPQQVKQAADGFAVYYKRGENTEGGYLMDHSRVVYLMDPEGKPIAMLPVDKGKDAVAAELARWVN